MTGFFCRPAERCHLWRLLALAGAVLVSGCTRYQPSPLPGQSGLANTLKELKVDATTLGKTRPAEHEINLADGLDLTDVAIVAVLNNPDIKARRTQIGVAGAQLFAAGLLPDPRISASFDNPTDDLPGLVNGLGAGLAYEIVPLITRQARVDAARLEQSKLILSLLWQEWQVMQRARALAVRYQLEKQQLDVLHEILGLYRQRYRHSTRALAAGDITIDVNGTDLTALLDTTSQINQLEQTHNRTGHSLHLMLGLQPDVKILLQPIPSLAWPDVQTIRKQLASLAQKRPDLLALKAGYQSQEARVRAAVLAQFPSISVGFNRLRDTGNVQTNGISIGLTLPLFSGNRGAIAIERATRHRLQTEYQARLAQTEVDADRLLDLHAIVARQQETLATYVPRLKEIVDKTRAAYQKGDIDALTFLNMELTWISKRLEQIRLVQTQWENSIALESILALPGVRPTAPDIVDGSNPP